MGAKEKILESFFAAISNNELFEKSFIDELQVLFKTRTLDKEALRTLIERANPVAAED